jgi:rod shape-determining protein MreD
MPVIRAVTFLVLLLTALVLQVSFFGYFAWVGVVPNLVLLVVVAAGLTRGPEVAALLGFVGGLALDLVPPADHVAGRWALALVLVGYLAGRVRQDSGRSSLVALATVAACSFVGTSVYALSGMLLRDPSIPVTDALRVIPTALVYDLLLAPFVLPPLLRLFRRMRPAQVVY